MSVPASNGTLPLAEVRARVGLALAPSAEGDPAIHVDYPDAVSPPAILVLWEDPWLEPQTFGQHLYTARLVLLAIAGRVEPGPGVTKLEELVTFAIGRLQADPYPWPVASLQAPRAFQIAGVQYLGARVAYSLRVSV